MFRKIRNTVLVLMLSIIFVSGLLSLFGYTPIHKLVTTIDDPVQIGPSQSCADSGTVCIGDTATGNDASVSIGKNSDCNNSDASDVCILGDADSSSGSVAILGDACLNADSGDCVAIMGTAGGGVNNTGMHVTVGGLAGNGTGTFGGTAIGQQSNACSGNDSDHCTAVGQGASAAPDYSAAFGAGANSSIANQIMLGRTADLVVAPGNTDELAIFVLSSGAEIVYKTDDSTCTKCAPSNANVMTCTSVACP